MALFGAKKDDKPAKTFTADVNGVKLTAPSQEELMGMVTQLQGAKPSKTRKAKPTARRSSLPGNQGTNEVKKWTQEEVAAELEKDPHRAITTIVSQQLGIKDLGEAIKQILNLSQTTYGLAYDNSMAQVLRENNIKPTEGNMEELRNLMHAQPASKQSASYENLSSVVSEALEQEWIKADSEPTDKGKAKPKLGKAGLGAITVDDNKVIEGNFPTRGGETSLDADEITSTIPGKPTDAEVAEIEKLVKDTPREEMIEMLNTSQEAG